jgi:MFS family permease
VSETVRGRAPEEIPSAADGPDLTPQPRRWFVFAVVGLSLLMFAMDQTAVATALTALGRDLGADLAWTGWTITIYSVGQILALPLGGRLSDQFGGRRVFLVAVAVFALTSLACGMAGNLGQLVGCRFLQGLACGVLLPAGSGIVAHAFGRDRDRALALFTSVFPFGAIAGPLLGGLILTVAGWRGIFLISLPIGLVLLVAGHLLVRDPPRKRPQRVDLAGIVLITVMLLTGMTAIARLGSLGSGTAGPLTVAGAALASVAAGWTFVRHARRHPDPVVPLRLLSGGGLGSMNAANVVLGAAALGFSALVPLYAQTRYAMLPLAAGVLLTARAVGMVIASSTAVALLRRTGHRPLLMVGMGAAVTGLALTAVPPAAGLSPALWLGIASAVMGIGMGFAAPASNNAGMHLVPDSVSAMSGLRILFRQLGAIVAVSVTTAVSASSSDPGVATGWAFGVLAVLMAGATVVAARVPNQRGRW